MKKQIRYTLLSLLILSSSALYAGSGSFFGGFALGTATTSIAHAIHRPRYVEVHHHRPVVTHTEYVEVRNVDTTESRLRRKIDRLETDNSALRIDNRALKVDNDDLRDDLEHEQIKNRSEQRKLKQTINELKSDFHVLEKKIERLQAKESIKKESQKEIGLK